MKKVVVPSEVLGAPLFLVPLTANFQFQNGFIYLNSPLKRAGKVAMIPET